LDKLFSTLDEGTEGTVDGCCTGRSIANASEEVPLGLILGKVMSDFGGNLISAAEVFLNSNPPFTSEGLFEVEVVDTSSA
jgi:hypothetical protein